MSCTDLAREARFLLGRPAALALIGFFGALSAFSVGSGLAEVSAQQATLARLLQADARDREGEIAGRTDYGEVAYYTFHLTYDPPSDLAFAALGQRDLFPWKHRVRMLALEGQIHETDAANPELALAGRIDFAFVVGFLLPLAVILLLYDLRASERAAGRDALLVATAGDGGRVWRSRAAVRLAALGIALLVPFWIGAFLSGASPAASLLASLVVLAHLAVWALVTLWAASWRVSAPVIAAALLGTWLATAFVLPLTAKAVIERAIPIPAGGDILLTQREAVNDAWDLPKEATMEPFVARHPQWAHATEVTQPFEWKWYYAFQQVGDQAAEHLSQDYRQGVAARDRASGTAALLSPPTLVQRVLSRLAGTDVEAAQAYERRVRQFHAELRDFYYPLVFEEGAFDPAVLAEMPEFRLQEAG